ncbi:DUF262 domain-containing protein [Arcicella rosea]|uniref:Uncharacterized protein with ParB-like and HNH nuclease domain n=1 Tax=Arcicella rosea TaxID=502909 RepID=A0A841EWM9_9BACT|nr:DUF262 domain-containing protein [Arcicella rosea]MBB6005493.1 uncharacterized protein with ParB-like and HNH nuclease domain [Arcicella rosea]
MTGIVKIKPDKQSLPDYINDFEKGGLQVPAFQRDFLWTNDKKLELFDSIKKGYPIGSILLWQPNFNDEDDYKKLGSDRLGSYETPTRINNFFYILDGFQRLSTLIGCLFHPNRAKQKGIEKDENEWQKKFNIVYNLKDEEFEINRSKGFQGLEFYQVPIYKLVDGKEFFSFQRSLFNNDDAELYIQRYEEMSLVFQKYEIPNIEIHGGSVSEAVDIFQRLNSTGSPITADWIVSARAFGKDNNFRFGTEIDRLLDSKLSKLNFDSLKRNVILQCITNSFDGVFFDQMSKNSSKKLEDLVDRNDFIPVTKKTFGAIEKAVEFLFQYLFVLDSKFLPYNNQLIFITDFFNKIDNPSQIHIDKLKYWFWVTTYSNYFTIYNLSKQRKAYEEFQKFLEDENYNPIYFDKPIPFETVEFPPKIEMGSVRSKALGLFMLQYQMKNLPLDVSQVNGYKKYYLFGDVEDINISENTVLIIDDGKQIYKKSKDLSEWLGSNEDYSAFFITDEMKYMFNSNLSKSEILLKRKELIVQKEKEFVVNDLKIMYM